MNNDPKQYDEDNIYEDGYDTDDYDYIVDDEDEDENALWDDIDTPTADDSDEPPQKKRRKQKEAVYADVDADEAEVEEYEQAQRRLAGEQRLIDELEADAAENPIEEDEEESDEQPGRKLLKRELKAQALKRLEDSARTQRDFENVVAWWDKLDANRERRERYHELSRSGDDVPLDYGAAADRLYFPDTLNDVLAKLERKGDFIDSIFYCPYDIHELVTEEYLSKILLELNEDQKFLLFLWALRQYSSTRIAVIKEQSDRNIRKVRNTMLGQIRKKLLAALSEKVQKQPLTLLEKDFLTDHGIPIE